MSSLTTGGEVLPKTASELAKTKRLPGLFSRSASSTFLVPLDVDPHAQVEVRLGGGADHRREVVGEVDVRRKLFKPLWHLTGRAAGC